MRWVRCETECSSWVPSHGKAGVAYCSAEVEGIIVASDKKVWVSRANIYKSFHLCPLFLCTVGVDASSALLSGLGNILGGSSLLE